MQAFLQEFTDLLNKHGAIVKNVTITWQHAATPMVAAVEMKIINSNVVVAGGLAQSTLPPHPPPKLPRAAKESAAVAPASAEEAECEHSWKRRRYNPGYWCTKCPATTISLP